VHCILRFLLHKSERFNQTQATTQLPTSGYHPTCTKKQRPPHQPHLPPTHSIFGFSGGAADDEDDEDDTPLPRAAILLAAWCVGTCSMLLERHPVITDPTWSCLELWASGAASLSRSAPSEGLPGDWQLLQQEAGLQSFTVVPIGPPNKPVGALMIATESCGLIDPVCPSMAAVALVHHIRHWQSAAASALLREAAAATDQIAMISAMLRVRAVGCLAVWLLGCLSVGRTLGLMSACSVHNQTSCHWCVPH